MLVHWKKFDQRMLEDKVEEGSRNLYAIYTNNSKICKLSGILSRNDRTAGCMGNQTSRGGSEG